MSNRIVVFVILVVLAVTGPVVSDWVLAHGGRGHEQGQQQGVAKGHKDKDKPGKPDKPGTSAPSGQSDVVDEEDAEGYVWLIRDLQRPGYFFKMEDSEVGILSYERREDCLRAVKFLNARYTEGSKEWKRYYCVRVAE